MRIVPWEPAIDTSVTPRAHFENNNNMNIRQDLDGLEMCTAIRMYNFIKTIDEEHGNPLLMAAEEFKDEIIKTTLSGGHEDDSHGVYYLFRDCSAMSLYQRGMTISTPDMVLNSVAKDSLKAYEEKCGKDRIRHHG